MFELFPQLFKVTRINTEKYKAEKGTQEIKYKNQEIVKCENLEIQKWENPKMQRIKYSNDILAFENPKTNVIILRTNLHIKHFIAIVLNTHEHIPLCRDQK